MTDTKSGFIALVGAPNAGKSTFFNKVMGQKLAIVSPKAQTTRFAIRGIVTDEEMGTQMVLVDTPGIHRPARLFDKMMVESAHAALAEADAILVFVDAVKGITEEVENVFKNLVGVHQPIFLVLNKVDKVKPRDKLLPLMEEVNNRGLFKEVFAVSALRGSGVPDVLKRLAGCLPKGPFLYDADMLTDLPNALLAAEITREKAFISLREELPYDLLVETEMFEEQPDGSIKIYQNLIVKRDGQKKIVLGHHGATIKKIGQESRKELSRLFGKKVHVFLKVKVRGKWDEDKNILYDPLQE